MNEDFNSQFDYICVDKLIGLEDKILCLQSYKYGLGISDAQSSVVGLTLDDDTTIQQTLFYSNAAISDITITTNNTIWAVDTFGHLHCSKAHLNNNALHEELEVISLVGRWSSEWFTNETPLCVTGEDTDLWIATKRGSLLHYNGKTFEKQEGLNKPIAFKSIKGITYLLGGNRDIWQLSGSEWSRLAFHDDIDTNTAVIGLTGLGDRLVAVCDDGSIVISLN